MNSSRLASVAILLASFLLPPLASDVMARAGQLGAARDALRSRAPSRHHLSLARRSSVGARWEAAKRREAIVRIAGKRFQGAFSVRDLQKSGWKPVGQLKTKFVNRSKVGRTSLPRKVNVRTYAKGPHRVEVTLNGSGHTTGRITGFHAGPRHEGVARGTVVSGQVFSFSRFGHNYYGKGRFRARGNGHYERLDGSAAGTLYYKDTGRFFPVGGRSPRDGSSDSGLKH